MLFRAMAYSTNLPGQETGALRGIDAAVFLLAIGAIASAARHQFNTSMRMAAMEAVVTAITEKTLYPLLGPANSISEIGVKAIPSSEVSAPDPVSAETVAPDTGTPGRRIFSVFFCVTVAESAVAAGAGMTGVGEIASDGIAESGIREV